MNFLKFEFLHLLLILDYSSFEGYIYEEIFSQTSYNGFSIILN